MSKKNEKFLAVNGSLWYTREINGRLFGTQELKLVLTLHGKTETEKEWNERLTAVDSFENLMEWPDEWLTQMY